MQILNHVQQILQSSPVYEQWKQIGIHHHHGIDIPLFSLHSRKSCGIGEFTDLIPLFDWCREIGFDVIQLLPLNDTGPESSPYSALSAFALNPIHLGLADLPRIEHYPDLMNQISDLQKFTNQSRIDYSQVRPAKFRFLRKYYQYEKNRVLQDRSFRSFLEENEWLRGYALFKALKVSKQWHSWREWEETLQYPNERTVQNLFMQFQEEINFHLFLQYLCFQQFKQVSDLGTEKGIYLKGDIPILISPESADVWLHPDIFRLDLTAGAPPDMYTPEGQTWGFPIFRWDEIRRNDYAWWKQRLQVSEVFYDLCRLDHIIGFFRIWAIPPGMPGTAGNFIPPDRNTWLEHGRDILLMIGKSTKMLPIGEDLGDIPQSVHNFLQGMGICGTRVMRWQREISSTEGNYIDPSKYHPITMTSVSTHDAETMHMWWKKYRDDAKLLAEMKGWQYHPELTSEQHFEILHDSHHSGSLFHINLLQEYLALFPELRWENTDLERVNTPGTVSPYNWSVRYKPSVEEILGNEKLSLMMQKLVA